MNQDTNKTLNGIINQIMNVYNFEKTAKRYWDKYNMLDEYTGVKSIRTDVEVSSGQKRTYADIIDEKDYCYKQYLYYTGKVKDIYDMLNVLTNKEKEILIDWYTTPKQYRVDAYTFAKERGLSRASMFRMKQEALRKLLVFI